MAKMAATPIYGKNPLKISPKPAGRFPRNLVCSNGDSNPSKFILFIWWPWLDLDLFYGKFQFCNLGFTKEKVKTLFFCVFFSETIAASDLKVGRCKHLIEFLKVGEYWRLMSFLDLCPRPNVVFVQNSNQIFWVIIVLFLTKFCMEAFRYKEIKIWWHDAGHMTKMTTTPIYGKNLSKLFLLRNKNWVCSIGDSCQL